MSASIIGVLATRPGTPQQPQTPTATPSSPAGATPMERTPTPTPSSAYRAVYADKELSLPAPSVLEGCGATVNVDLDAPKVDTSGERPDRKVHDLYYEVCRGISVTNGGLAPVHSRPTPEECAYASDANPFPNPIPEEDIRRREPLAKGMSLCLRTVQGRVAHLTVLDVAGARGDLKNYRFAVSLWVSEAP